MQDTIIKGTGNSRTLASVPNFLTLYPTYEAFAQALLEGTLPIDIGPLNAAGVDVLGTLLNKANLLTDATEQSIWGSAADRTVNAALAQLRSLVSTAQSTADKVTSKANFQYGSVSYTGTGNMVFNCSFSPKLVIFTKNDATNYFFAISPNTKTSSSGLTVTWTGNNLQVSATSSGTYYYVAFG